ncbi:MAG: O-antigen polymerase [Alkaliphilus sp.]
MKKILNKKNSRIVNVFVFSHLFAHIALSLIPARAVIPNIPFLILLNSMFIGLVLAFSIVTYKIFFKKKYKTKVNPLTSYQLNINIKFVSYASIIGFFMILYDRVFIRGLDFSLGLRNARYQWLASQGGSLPSIIGNVIVPFGYVSIFFLIVHFDNISKKNKGLLVVSSIISIFGFAALNAGRSNILLAVIFILISVLISNISFAKLFEIKLKSTKKWLLGILILGYISMITISSATMGNIDLKTLTQLSIESLHGKTTVNFDNICGSNGFIFLIIHSVSYLYHGQWTSQAVHFLSNNSGHYTFNVFSIYLYRLGIIDEPLARAYFSELGIFMSLPGGLYYDFGFWGVFVFSAILGVLLGIVMLILNFNTSIDGIKLAFVFYVLFILILSPIIPAFGFTYLNFIVFSLVLLGIINLVLFKRRSNWLEVE